MLVLVLDIHAPFVAGAPGQACDGCLGSGGTAASSGGSCDGTVTISAEVERGDCGWFQGEDPLAPGCRQKRGCETTVTRAWSDLPPDTLVEHVLQRGEQRLHLVPAESSGSGTGRTVRKGPILDCSSDPSQGLIFMIESKDCGLSARVRASCSRCNGNL